MRQLITRVRVLGLLAATACSSSNGSQDGGATSDAGVDASKDASTHDAGADATSPPDAGPDATSPHDAGADATSPPDAGPDATSPHDAGADATSPPDAAPTSDGSSKPDASLEAGQDGRTDAPAPDSGSMLDAAGGFGAAVSVAVGNSDACAVTSAGAVVCWGSNTSSQLGSGSTTPASSSVPLQVQGLASGVKSVVVGDSFACALTSAGAVWCWGTNTSGQLGVPTTTTSSASPVEVTGLTSGITAITAGESAACALNTSGGVVCWGADYASQLGNPSVSGLSATPVAVSGLSSGVTSVSMGDDSACATTSAGAVYCWGGNTEGDLGDGNDEPSATPVAVQGLATTAASVTVGWDAACAVLTTGAVQCWGYNGTDVLGEPSTTSYSYSPVTVSISGVTSLSLDYISTGAAAAITTGGELLTWGYDAYGELGDGLKTNTPTPVVVTGLTSGVTSASMGVDSACAVYACGVKCWGNNPFGELGIPTTTGDSTAPVDVQLLGASSCP